MDKKIRLTESDLHRIVKESVNRVLKEGLTYTQADQAKELFAKAFANLEPQEKDVLYNMLNEDSWGCVYAAMSALRSRL